MTTLAPDRQSDGLTDTDLEEMLSHGLPPCQMVIYEVCEIHGYHPKRQCERPSVAVGTGVCPTHGPIDTQAVCESCKREIETGNALLMCSCGERATMTFS